MTDLPINAPSPRQCDIFKWANFDGYGFNLHADKTRPGQYIGKVDENSPADIAGLKEGDRIIEVNGVNISNENHKQVVQRIKSISNETKLLVVDSEADRWYKDHNLVVRGDQPNIIFGTSNQQQQKAPVTEAHESPKTSAKKEKINFETIEEDSKSVESSSSSHSEQSTQPQQEDKLPENEEISDKNALASLTIEESNPELPPPPTPPVAEDDHSAADVPLDSDLSLEYDNIRFEQEEKNEVTKPVLEESHSISSHSSSRSGDETSKPHNETAESLPDTEPDQEERKSPMSTTPSPPPSLNPEGNSTNRNSPSQNSTRNGSGLNLNMTAAEMRAQLASKKKFDPRKDQIDLKKKYQIIQNM